MRVTRNGWGVLLGSTALGALGLLLGVTAALAVAVAGLAAVALAAITVSEPPPVEVTRSAWPAEVSRGQDAQIRLTFRSRSGRRTRPFTMVETIAGERHVAVVPPIDRGNQRRLPYALDTGRRGLVTAGPMLLRRTDSLGLILAERHVGGTVTVAVRPRRVPLRMLPSGRMRDLEGPTREVSQGSATFLQLREYVPGDDLRHIHWRTTARTGHLMVKQMVDTTRPEVVVVVDNRAARSPAEDFEGVVEVAASVLHAAERDGFPTLLLFTDGARHDGPDGLPLPHLERLTVATQTEEDSLTALARSLRGRGRSLVFVTGELPATDLQLLAELAQPFSPAIVVSVAAARTAPFIAPPGLQAITCADVDTFALEWGEPR